MRRRGHTVRTYAEPSTYAEPNAFAKLVDAGPYYTDGIRLFRLAGMVAGTNGPKVMKLEDCRTLQVSGYTAEEAELIGLMPVRVRAAHDQAKSGLSVSGPRDSEHRHRARAHQP